AVLRPRSAFLTAAWKAAGRSPRTVIGSFGIGADRQIVRNFDASNWPAWLAVACCWLLTSPASTLPFPSAGGDAGWEPANWIVTSLSGLIPTALRAARGSRFPEVEPGSEKAIVCPLRSARVWIDELVGTQSAAV